MEIKLSNIIENYTIFQGRILNSLSARKKISNKLLEFLSVDKLNTVIYNQATLILFINELLNNFSIIKQFLNYNEIEIQSIENSLKNYQTSQKIFDTLLSKLSIQLYKNVVKEKTENKKPAYSELLSLKNNDIQIDQYFRKFNSKYDLASNLNIIEKISFETYKERLDYSYDFIIINSSNKCIAILGRDEYCENEEEYEYTTVLYTFNKNEFNSIKSWNKALKTATNIKIFSIDKTIPEKKKDSKYFYDPKYQFELKKDKRNEIINKIIFLKIMNEIVIGIDEIQINKNQIEIWFKLAITKAYKLMEKRNLFKPLIEITNVEITEMEYDPKRGFYYLSIKTPYKYMELDKFNNYNIEKFDRYANFMPSNVQRNPQLPEIIVLRIMLVKALTQYARIFYNSFIDKISGSNWTNYDQGNFDQNLIEKYAPNCIPYSISLTK